MQTKLFAVRTKNRPCAIAADGKVFFTNEAGSTLVLDATQSDYQELARNEIGEEVFALAAIAQGRFFVRTAKSLVCIGTK